MALNFSESAWLATIPLAGVIGGYISSFLVTNRTVYINSITKERSQWIEKLRSSLAEFTSSLEAYSLCIRLMFPAGNPDGDYSVVSKIDLVKASRELDHLAFVLQLQLNPRGEIDGNIARLVESASAYRACPADLLKPLQKLIVEHSQWLLKAEWEKVKWEAKSGWWRLGHLGDEPRLLNDYQRWVNGAGAFEPLVSKLKVSASLFDHA